MNFILLTPAEAFTLSGEADGARLAPRLVLAGPHAGKSVLPMAVLDDPDHADKAQVFALLPVVDLDAAEAWPQTDI